MARSGYIYLVGDHKRVAAFTVKYEAEAWRDANMPDSEVLGRRVDYSAAAVFLWSDLNAARPGGKDD